MRALEDWKPRGLRQHEGIRFLLYSGSSSLGGKLRRDAALPGRSEISRIIDYQTHLAELFGVDIRLGEFGDASLTRKDSPDAVVCATGSILSPPPSLSDEETRELMQFLI